jgi:chemotaxis signal transduction protein
MEDEIVLEMAEPSPAGDTTAPEAHGVATDGIPEQEVAAELPPERQYCIFRAGWERYCMSVLEIEEVVDWPKVTPVPLAPDYLLGIFNLRGAIVPVVDVAVGQGRRFESAIKRIVVGFLRSDDGQGFNRIGIAADEVVGTHTTTEPLATEGIPQAVAHCCGLLQVRDKRAMVLDLKRVLEIFPIPVI